MINKNNFWKKAQSMAEYAVIIACVAAAVGAMGVFFRAGLQKRLRSLCQELATTPYLPRMTASSSSSSATSEITETYQRGVSRVDFRESTQRSGWERVFPERR
ncbi:MAG: hypothetical protein NC912_03770 [Candidatus Omnitrophica bacterium]|nr:hypothetical protein [Candidatus Omnitrophota bacterium]